MTKTSKTSLATTTSALFDIMRYNYMRFFLLLCCAVLPLLMLLLSVYVSVSFNPPCLIGFQVVFVVAILITGICRFFFGQVHKINRKHNYFVVVVLVVYPYLYHQCFPIYTICITTSSFDYFLPIVGVYVVNIMLYLPISSFEEICEGQLMKQHTPVNETLGTACGLA